MSKKITLYQALKKSGLFKNKEEIADAVNKGKITVDGIETRSLQFQFSPNKRTVCFNKKPIEFIEKKYFLMNKPAGYSCQKNDKDPYVVDLLNISETIKNSLFPVGRLDVATTGLLIITNDGDFAAKILSEKISKSYKVEVKEQITEEQIKKLEEGIVIQVSGEQYTTKPAKVEKINDNILIITINEGKNRQVRKMIEAVGNEIQTLERVAIGNIQLHELKKEQYKECILDQLRI